ncbi:MAG: hypothetical protein ACI9AT_000418 [Ulvibacter sp.]|jgi:hypothetical protein
MKIVTIKLLLELTDEQYSSSKFQELINRFSSSTGKNFIFENALSEMEEGQVSLAVLDATPSQNPSLNEYNSKEKLDYKEGVIYHYTFNDNIEIQWIMDFVEIRNGMHVGGNLLYTCLPVDQPLSFGAFQGFIRPSDFEIRETTDDESLWFKLCNEAEKYVVDPKLNIETN